MGTKKPSKGPLSPRVPGHGHGGAPNRHVPPLPKVNPNPRSPQLPAKGASTKKATPGGDNGALHRKSHPPMPAPRPVKRVVRKGS